MNRAILRLKLSNFEFMRRLYSYEDSLVYGDAITDYQDVRVGSCWPTTDIQKQKHISYPAAHATFPVVTQKKINESISDEQPYTYNYIYPRDEKGHIHKISYILPNSEDAKDYFFENVIVDNPSQIKDERYEFENGLLTKRIDGDYDGNEIFTEGLRSTEMQWDYENIRQTAIIAKKADVIQTEKIFQDYDAYNNPLTIITKVEGQDYLIQENSYYDDADFINNNLPHLIKVSKIKEPGSVQEKAVYYEYDPNGKPTEVYQGAGSDGVHLKSFSYTADGQMQTETAYGPSGALTLSYDYTENEAVLQVTKSSNGKEQIEEYAKSTGDLVKETDVNGNTAIYAYDNYGRPASITFPDESTKSYTYSDDLKTVSTTFAGRTVTQISDNFGRPLMIDYPDGEEDVKYEYYFANKVSKTFKKRNDVWILKKDIKYDDYLREITVATPEWGEITYQYDDTNDKIIITDQQNRQTEKSYDVLKRLTSQTYLPTDSTTDYHYDAFGNAIQVTDPKGLVHAADYDVYGRLTRSYHTYKESGVPNLRSELSYFDNGQIDSIDVKDENGNLFRSYAYQYDTEGRLVHLELDGQIKETNSYDQVGRENGKGRLTGVKNDMFKAIFDYDEMGRIKKEAKAYTAVGSVFTSEYDYNAFGALSDFTYSDGRQLNYGYDAHQRLESVGYDGNPILQYTYNANGTIASLQYGNGHFIEYEYVKEMLVTHFVVKDSDGNTIYEHYYSYDELGNMKASTHNDLFDPGKELERIYGYNVKNELTSVALNGAADYYRYAYDKNGNRTLYKNPFDQGNDANFIIDENSDKIVARIYPRGKITFGYDPEGNMIQKRIFTDDPLTPAKEVEYVYNYQGQLAEVKVNGQTLATYHYDTQRRRIYSDVNGAKTIYHWDTTGHIIGESTPTQDFAIRYIYSDNQKIAMIRPDLNGEEKIYYFINNIQGTPVLILDRQGNVVQRIRMDAYGNVERVDGIFIDEINFTGKKFDPVTRLFYFNQRYYDPDLGRFITEDPSHQLLNLYLYSSNNPLMYVDADGEFFQFLIPFIIEGFKAAAINAAVQWISNDFDASKIDWNGVGKSFIAGGISNFTGGLVTPGGDDLFSDLLAGGINEGITNTAIGLATGSNENALDMFTRGFGVGALAAFANTIYEDVAGYEADPNPGTKGVLKERPVGKNVVKGYNCFGTPVNVPGVKITLNPVSWLEGFFVEILPGREGGPVSFVANFIPGLNALSHFHDNLSPNLFAAIVSVGHSAGITYTALAPTMRNYGMIRY